MKTMQLSHRLAAVALVAFALVHAPKAQAGLESATSPTPDIAAAPRWVEQVPLWIEQAAPPADRQNADSTARAFSASGPAGEVQGSDADAVSNSLAAAGRGTPSLWALITTVRAQQAGESFVVLESNLATANLLQPEAVAPVPLPAALWFLLMGLLGWLGTSLRTPRSSGPAAAPARALRGA